MMLLEIAVDDPASIAAALQGGADRIELCAALQVGGLTPSAGLMRQAAACGVPVMAMIRPRAGGFVYDDAELAVMCDDIAIARQAGLAGVVFGGLTPDRRLDLPAMQRLCRAAQGMQVTLHRAFDLIEEWKPALDQTIGLGIQRVLTSGGAVSAPLGRARIAACLSHAGERISIMPGAGISAESIGALAGLPLRDVHASCAAPLAAEPAALAFGFASADARRTDAARVAALKAALSRL